MGLFTADSPETKCLEGLRALHAHRDRLERTIVEHEAELAKLRSVDFGERALDSFLQGPPADNEGFPVASEHARIGAIESKLADLTAARTALCKRVRAGIVALGAARAGELRKLAKKRESELAVHRAKVAELLSTLQETAGCKYVIDTLCDATVLTDQAGKESLFRSTPRLLPKSMQYEAEIARLKGQAAAAEARAQQNCEGGQIAGENLDALLAVCDNVELLAPASATVRSWFEQATAQAAEAWSLQAAELSGTNYVTGHHQDAPDHDVVYTICFDADGNLVESRCNWKNRPGRLTMPATASVGAAADARRW